MVLSGEEDTHHTHTHILTHTHTQRKRERRMEIYKGNMGRRNLVLWKRRRNPFKCASLFKLRRATKELLGSLQNPPLFTLDSPVIEGGSPFDLHVKTRVLQKSLITEYIPTQPIPLFLRTDFFVSSYSSVANQRAVL